MQYERDSNIKIEIRYREQEEPLTDEDKTKDFYKQLEESRKNYKAKE